MHSFEPLPRFVDEYLGYLHEAHPTLATFDGVHAHDDLLEDLSRPAIEQDVRELGRFQRRLAAIESSGLNSIERLERPLVETDIQRRLYELEQIRTWERNPQYYADILATSLASQTLFTHASLEDRARRILSKLRQTPRLLRAARENIRDTAGILVKIGIETMRGTLGFVEDDLPRAFGSLDDPHLLGDLADAASEAASALASYIAHLEELAPKSRSSFRLGRDRFEAKLKLDEGIGLSAARLLEIALRELRATQATFREEASRLGKGDPVENWRRFKAEHPAVGGLVQVAQSQLAELLAFIERHRIITVPNSEPVIVAPSPRFHRWTFASMWTPGPFETRPVHAYYYITDADSSWPPERQEEHMRDFNYGALWAISIHEVYPGHFLHYQHLRPIESKLRKSILFSSVAFVEGWAHYCEQMMVESGFRRKDPAVRLGQLAEALIRLCRFVVGIRLHADDLSVEQGVRFFREEAFMEEATARREAERGAFDPDYVRYSLGKLLLLKLRGDYEADHGAKFSPRGFHDALLANGTVPFWLHRKLLLGETENGVPIA